MRDVEINILSLDELPDAADQLLQVCTGYYQLAFKGDMGAGKTTFIKTICGKLSSDDASSPTYALVNEYRIADPSSPKKRIYHMDLYRLKSQEEALDMGIEEYLDDKEAWCFIEWPEILGIILPDEIVTIFIVRNEDESRTLSIHLP